MLIPETGLFKKIQQQFLSPGIVPEYYFVAKYAAGGHGKKESATTEQGVSNMMGSISRFILKICGWQVDLAVKLPDKCVLVGAPHTTNWDFPLAILGMSAMGIQFNWVAKHTLFHWPLGYIMRFLGGIPLERRSGGAGFTIKALSAFQRREHFVLAIAPEGTRHKTAGWKGGFYRIALKSQVPIALGYVDFPSRKVGIGKLFMPSGRPEDDFGMIIDFYRDKRGKYPDRQGPVHLH